MAEWFSSMEWFERIFWIIAIPSSLIFMIQLVLSFFGAEVDTDADFDGDLDGEIGADSDAEAGFHIFTVRNLVSFFTMFGWSGIAFYHQGLSNLAVVSIATALGLLMMFAVAGMFYMFSKSVESGTMNIKNAIDGVGEVYLPIKAKRGNIGRISIAIQGSSREMEAMTDGNKDLPTGTVVEVVDVINNKILLVEKS